jgi:hypothetical protein
MNLSTRFAWASAALLPVLIIAAGAALVQWETADLRAERDTYLHTRADYLAPQASSLAAQTSEPASQVWCAREPAPGSRCVAGSTRSTTSPGSWTRPWLAATSRVPGARVRDRVVSVVAPRVARAVGALSLSVALVSSLSGCRSRTVSNQNVPTVPPSAVSTGAGPGSVGQQDLDGLNGILASVGGAVTSVRSAITADNATPNG